MKIKRYGARLEELKRAGKTNREMAEAVYETTSKILHYSVDVRSREPL